MGKKHKKGQPGMTNQGVRDLNLPGWRERVRLLAEPVTPYVLPDAATQKTLIVDLLYCALDPGDKDKILATWPDARFEQTYDFIHEYRTGVRLPSCSYFDWYRFLVRSELGSISFALQMAMLEEQKLIEAVLDAERPGWRERAAERKTREA